MAANELSRPLPSLKALISLSDNELGAIDIALVNLACAVGLPGAENLDIQALLLKVDLWADQVKHDTQRMWYRFLADPADYENSAAYFRILVGITVLQRHLGVRYNPERAKDSKFQDPLNIHPDFRDSRDLFIHGILNGPGGTGASMPVLYTAVFRRIDYPIFLVEAKDHCFCRWDSQLDPRQIFMPIERFNIEGAGQGFGMYPDSFYETWPLKPAEFERPFLFKSMTPREELACFLSTRGHCLRDNGRSKEAIECFRWTVELAPNDVRYQKQLESALDRGGRYHIPQRNPYPPGQIPKVAYGTIPPSWIPSYLPIKWVPAYEADKYPPGMEPPPDGIVKIPYDTPFPTNLPAGTRYQYVDASEADLLPGGRPMPGRVYKVAAGKPLPTCLPPGTPMQVVPAHLADDFSVYENQNRSMGRPPLPSNLGHTTSRTYTPGIGGPSPLPGIPGSRPPGLPGY